MLYFLWSPTRFPLDIKNDLKNIIEFEVATLESTYGVLIYLWLISWYGDHDKIELHPLSQTHIILAYYDCVSLVEKWVSCEL